MDTLLKTVGPEPSDFMGNWPNPDWLVAPVSNMRDGNLLDRSNWDCQIDALAELNTPDTWEIIRHGHWACGWFEFVILAPESEAADVCDTLARDLAEYPVLDETDYSKREWEAMEELWNDARDGDYIEDYAGKDTTESELAELKEMSLSDLWDNGYDDLCEHLRVSANE
jgi:hypothetical protein